MINKFLEVRSNKNMYNGNKRENNKLENTEKE